MNIQRIRKLEKSIRDSVEEKLVVLPSHLEDQVKLPPNAKVVFLAAAMLEKNDIPWHEDVERFRVKNDT